MKHTHLKERMTARFAGVPEGLRSAVVSALIILQFVVPFYILADILLYFNLLRPLGVLLAPLTRFLQLPVEAAPALAAGIFLNVYTAIAFAAPLGLSAQQWTILGVFIGVCHSLPVENAIMARLGIANLYSIALRFFGGLVAVLPLILMPASLADNAASASGRELVSQEYDNFVTMLLHSATEALVLSAKVIVLVSALILIMDRIKAIPAVQRHMERANTAFSIAVGQALGITYGAGILLREASRGSLSRRDIFFIGTFLMICHSIIEDVLLFALFGANFWIMLLVRIVAALAFSFALLHIFKGAALDLVMRK